MKKLLSLLLALSCCSALLISCTREEQNKETEDNSEQKESAYFFPENLPNEDYDGYEFRILSCGTTGGTHWSAFEFIYDDSISADVVNDAVNARDKILEEKYNIKLKYLEYQKSDLGDYARRTILAGSDDFDLLSIGIAQAATLATTGLLLDLNEYKDILNLDESWWNQNANEQLSIKNRLYFTTSDLTLIDKNATWVVYFTKSMIEKYKLCPEYGNSLYNMVNEGDWTIEAMYNMVKTVSHDNGDGVSNEQDTYGHCGEAYNCAALMVGCESKITEKDSDDVPQYIWSDKVDQHVQSYNYVYDIVMDKQNSILSGKMQSLGFVKDPWVEGFGSLMENERVLFNVTAMNRCKLYRELECEFGIVPVPKATKEQDKYYSLVNTGHANCVAIPITCKNTDRTCVLLEALTCIASQTTYSAYIDKALTYQYLRDDDSAAMLEVIFNGCLLDPVDVYGWGSSNTLLFGSGNLNPSTVSSSIQSAKKVTTTMLKSGMEKFDKVAEQMQ